MCVLCALTGISLALPMLRISFSGSMTWNDSSKILLVWNLLDGADIYRPDHDGNGLRQIGRLRCNISPGRNFPFNLAFLGKDLAVCGTTDGKAHIWNLDQENIVAKLNHAASLIPIGVLPFPFLNLDYRSSDREEQVYRSRQ